MESGFWNLTAKVWANLDIYDQIKSYGFKKFWLICCMLPSQVALFAANCDVTTVHCIMKLHKLKKNLLFMKAFLHSTFIFRYVRAKMIVPAFMIEIDQPDYWYPRKLNVKIYGQNHLIVVLLWYITDSGRVLAEFCSEALRTIRKIIQINYLKTLYNQYSFKWIIQICSRFYHWVSKITFYSPMGKLSL